MYRRGCPKVGQSMFRCNFKRVREDRVAVNTGVVKERVERLRMTTNDIASLSDNTVLTVMQKYFEDELMQFFFCSSVGGDSRCQWRRHEQCCGDRQMARGHCVQVKTSCTNSFRYDGRHSIKTTSLTEKLCELNI